VVKVHGWEVDHEDYMDEDDVNSNAKKKLCPQTAISGSPRKFSGATFYLFRWYLPD